MVFSHYPHGQLCQIERIDELTQWLAASPNGEGSILLLSNVAFMNQTRDDVSILNAKIIVRSVDIRGDDGREVTPIFFGVGSIHSIDKSFGIRVSLVRRMGWTIVKHSLVDWVGRLVGEDACREHGNEFGNFVDAAIFHNVVVDEGIFSVEFDLEVKT